jgi:uncharacterized protein YrzB (UPF0473 family)
MPKNPSDETHDHEHDHEVAEEEELEEGEGEFDDLDDEDDIVTLVDAEGKEVDYHMMGLVEVDEETFALLTPVEEDDESESMEVVLMGYEEDEDGGLIFSDIEDEALFAKVQAAAETFFAEMMGEEEAD